MAIESGATALYNSPYGYRWQAYRRDGDIYAVLYEGDSVDSPVLDCSTGSSSQKTAPVLRPTPHGANQIDVFYANNDAARLHIGRVTFDVANKTSTWSTVQLRYQLDDETTSTLYTNGVSVTPVPGGVLTVTRGASKDENILCFFSNEDLQMLHKKKPPVATYWYALSTEGVTVSLDLSRSMATIVNSVEPNPGKNADEVPYVTGVRLVVTVKDTSQNPSTGIQVLEYTLGKNYEPTLVSNEPVQVDASTSIKTKFPVAQTAVDGRVYVSFYERNDDEIYVSQFVRKGTGTYGQTVAWEYDEKVDADLTPEGSRAIQPWRSPTLAFLPASDDSGIVDQGSNGTPGPGGVQVPVAEKISVVYGTGGLSIASKAFGYVCRRQMDAIPAVNVPPVLLGVARGGPPLSNGVLQSMGTSGTSVSSTTSIETTQTATRGSTATTAYSASLTVGGTVTVGAKVGNDNLYVEKNGGVSIRLSTQYAYQSVVQTYESVSVTNHISPSSKPTPIDGDYWIRPSGTAYLLKADIIGYAYYFAGPDVDDPANLDLQTGLPEDAAVLYDYTASNPYIQSLSFDIDKGPIPGVLSTYATPEHISALDALPTLPFVGGSRPQLSWNESSGNDVNVDVAFEESRRNISRNSWSVSSTVRTFWSKSIKAGIPSASVEVFAELALAYEYAEEIENGMAETFRLGATVDMDGHLGDSDLQSYVSQVYFIKPIDGSKQSRTMTADWIEGLKAYSTTSNDVLLEMLCDPDGQSRVTGSNPFFVDYSVVGLTPSDFQDPMPPFQALAEAVEEQDVSQADGALAVQAAGQSELAHA